MSKPNVTRVQSATEWTASVHTLHMSQPNVTRVQSATEWTASVHTLHMSTPNVTCVQSATEWTAWVHTSHMSKPNVTRVQSATEWTASVHTSHMSKPNVTRVQSATEWTASVHTLHIISKPNVTCVQSATEWTAWVHTSHMSKPNVARVLSATAWTASVHTSHIGTWTIEATFEGSRPSKLPSKGRDLWRYLWRSLRRYLRKGRDLPSYLRRVGSFEAFQAIFEGSGALKVPLKVPFEGTSERVGPSSYFRRVGTFEGTFEGLLWRSLGTFEGPFEGAFEGLRLSISKPATFSASAPPPGSQQRTFVEGLKGPDLRRYLRRRVLTDYPRVNYGVVLWWRQTNKTKTRPNKTTQRVRRWNPGFHFIFSRIASALTPSSEAGSHWYHCTLNRLHWTRRSLRVLTGLAGKKTTK